MELTKTPRPQIKLTFENDYTMAFDASESSTKIIIQEVVNNSIYHSKF
jgi:hypothetical protein